MVKIDEIKLQTILDSRGEKTLEAFIKSGDIEVISSIPKGKSRGKKEAFLTDTEIALKKFEKIKESLLKQGFCSQEEFDDFLIQLDGTANKSNLGGNLTLVLSQAFSRLMAKKEGLELWQYLEKEIFSLAPDLKEKNLQVFVPYFFFNLINAGKHASFGPRFQEYLIVPQVKDPVYSLSLAKEFFEALKNYFKKNYQKNEFGDEGGLLIPKTDFEEPLKIYFQIRKDLHLEDKIGFALDVAASSFYNQKDKKYYLEKDKNFSQEELAQIYKKINSSYRFFSLEDPFEENDWLGFKKIREIFTEESGGPLIIGDDLTATNLLLVKKAIEARAIDGLIINPTQIGTVTETLKTIVFAQKNDLKIIVSHRSAETKDDFIADLAWASRAFGLKAGAPQPEERMVKYNRIINIFNSQFPILKL